MTFGFIQSMLRYGIILVIFVQYSYGKSLSNRDDGTSFNCLKALSDMAPSQSFNRGKQPIKSITFDVLPGYAWDNLQNSEAGQVSLLSYYDCKITNGGNYIVPDNVYFVPVKESNVDQLAEVFQHWKDYKNPTSFSINAAADANFLKTISSINGLFSTEFLNSKSVLHYDKSVITRVQILRKVYVATLNPDSPLHPTFKSRLFDIGLQIQNNNRDYAEYLAQLLIRDYGTHQITQIIAGASIVKEDIINKDLVSKTKTKGYSIAAAATLSFFKLFSLEGGFSRNVSKTFMNQYENNTKYSKVRSYGGPAIAGNVSISDWNAGLTNNLVAIDRIGQPLFSFIKPLALPEMLSMTVNDVADTVKEATKDYYRFNTHYGCTNPESYRFDISANVEDNSCKTVKSNFTFGGTYQTCKLLTKINGQDICDEFREVNMLTGNMSCPAGYQSIKIHTGMVTRKQNTAAFCGMKCDEGLSVHDLEYRTCFHDCTNTYSASKFRYNIFWCSPLNTLNSKQSLSFGGFYSHKISNIYTGDMSCPTDFIPIKFGLEIRICVGVEKVKGIIDNSFAGIFSCSVGNPLVANIDFEKSHHWPKLCPAGYIRHLAGLDSGCEVEYCMSKSRDRDTSFRIRRPPYTEEPIQQPDRPFSFFMHGNDGVLWKRDGVSGKWILYRNATTRKETVASGAASGVKQRQLPESASDPRILGLSIGISIACGVVVVLSIILIRKKKSRTKNCLPIVRYNSMGNN